ncbi:unnamed protein product [Brachionus calyciflorus]|uniref:E3 ubiquitin-protein ligase n=1 Tax=Brachionus calyciflorus TaxID=104777 RepID=A0A813V2D1_9BILA|nr:unnamed protein product [Brachionus calyciflorus]
MTPPIRGVPLNTPNSRLLRIKVVQVKDLSKELFGSMDPFVQMVLCKKSNETSVIEFLKTPTIKKNSNPVYNIDFIFNVIPNEHKLIFDIINENRITRNDCVGRVTIPLDGSRIIILNEIDPNAFNKIDFPLEKKSLFNKAKGKLNLIIHYLTSIESIDRILSDNQLLQTPNVPINRLSLSNEGSSSSLNQNSPVQRNRSASITPSLNNSTQQQNSSNNSPLPSGWEQRFDQNGRIYYVDHVNKITTWIRPALRPIQASSPPNPNETSSNSTEESNENNPSQANAATMSRHHINDDLSNENESTQNGQSQVANSSDEDTASSSTESQTERPITTNGSNTSGVRPKPNEPALPPGWDFSYSDKGRIFFIDHVNKTTTWIDPRTGKPSPQPTLDFESRIGPLPPGWEERRHTDGRIFYIDHNRKHTQWEDPRLQKFAGPAVPYSRDYKQKFDTFRKMLPPPPPKGSQYGGIDKYFIRVKRNNVLEDSFNKIIHEKSPELLRMALWIEFEGEKSYDYGGVSREWFHVLSKEIFNPYYGLFEYSAIDNYTLQINPNSGLVNENHLEYFHFIGRVIGMAAYHNRLIDGFFIRPIYKMILNKPITLQDIEAVDIEYYKSMKFIMDTDDVESLDLTFTSESDVFGQKVEHELKPDGKNIKVTNENKKEFIDLVIQWRFVSRIEKQTNSFIKGFTEIVPRQCIQIFDPKEFELLLSGLGDVNIKDWQMNTVFKGEYNQHHRVITWFWMAMYSFPNELRLRFLQFVTGTSRVPMNGFAELQGSNGYQKFTIQSWGDYKQLPRAHTCFNRLDLPPYRSYEELREKLLLAIENSEGFDGVD